MRLSFASACAVLLSLFLAFPVLAFDTELSDEAIRDAYFRGQHSDRSMASFLAPYFRTLPAPDRGPYIAEAEIYTPYLFIMEASRRRTMNYSAQQAQADYRHNGGDKLYVRVRIDFTETYGLELYRSAKADQQLSGTERPLPDFYRDFRVGLSQRSRDTQEDQWIEPLRIILQPTSTADTGHYPFLPDDLGFAAYSFAGSGYTYGKRRSYYATGWLVWLEFGAQDVASDDATVHVITTDGQNVEIPFDLSRLR